MLYTEKQLYDFVTSAGLDATNVEAVKKAIAENLAKNTVPARTDTPSLYNGGPFSTVEGEVTSLVPGTGSPILNWLPVGDLKARHEEVNHLAWVSPNGFDGKETYPEFLASVDIGECGYGPTVGWSGFRYSQSGGSFSWTTETMQVYPDGGIPYYEKFPQYTTRNDTRIKLSSDREWAIAKLLIVAQQHADYVIKHGNKANSDMEWDGLDQVIRTGYVASRVQGTGVPTWADPLVINAAMFTTVAQLLNAVRVSVRMQRRRVQGRMWDMAADDMAILMPATMWDNLAEYIAAGAMYRYTNDFKFDGKQSFTEFRSEVARVRSGGLGYGTIDVDGTPVPVLPDVNMGEQTTQTISGVTKAAITGDIYILIRRAGGNTLLEQKYYNWNDANYPAFGDQMFPLQHGFMRAGWIEQNKKCYQYFSEMVGAVYNYMAPLQTRINNATLVMLDGEVNEATAFYASDNYAFGGRKGGQGSVLLTNFFK